MSNLRHLCLYNTNITGFYEFPLLEILELTGCKLQDTNIFNNIKLLKVKRCIVEKVFNISANIEVLCIRLCDFPISLFGGIKKVIIYSAAMIDYVMPYVSDSIKLICDSKSSIFKGFVKEIMK